MRSHAERGNAITKLLGFVWGGFEAKRQSTVSWPDSTAQKLLSSTAGLMVGCFANPPYELQ